MAVGEESSSLEMAVGEESTSMEMAVGEVISEADRSDSWNVDVFLET